MQSLSLWDLSWALLPVVIVGLIFFAWLRDYSQVAYASTRMLLQLLLVGYVLKVLFQQESGWLSLAVIGLMVIVSAWIALRPLQQPGSETVMAALAGIAIGGSFNLAVVVLLVLDGKSSLQPSVLIPLAGMVYANAMNAVSIAAERFAAETGRQLAPLVARNEAFAASMLPQINSLLAVGLVSLPGMMTGQILSGISPLEAVRYQIVVMCMILGSAGISTAIYLQLRLRQQ